MEQKKVRIGILGCANVAKKSAIAAFQALSNGELVCIASRDSAKARAWAEQYDIQNEAPYDALLQREDIDAVYIPLPIGLHEEWVLKAAQHEKHIICEKSLAGSYAAVKNMVDACRKAGVVLYENFMCGFHPQHEKVRQLLHDGSIGEPLVFQGYFGFPPLDKQSFRYSKALGGGCLNDAGAYTVFMARRMLEAEPLSVACTLFDDVETNIDVHGSALLEFPGQKTALVAFGFDNVYQNNYSIWGTKGLVRISRAYSIPPDVKPPVELLTNVAFKETIAPVDVPAANQFELIFGDFCETILKNDKTKRESTYRQLLAQGRAIEAARIAAKENRKVLLAEVEETEE